MKRFSLSILVFLTGFTISVAQVGINSDGSNPDGSAMLEVKATDRGFLLPRMTSSEISAIQSPANGLQVFCTTDDKIYVFVSSLGIWKEVAYGSGVIIPPFSCGQPLTVNHVASGGVAPVDKSVTYGTVTGIPGEASKCWITRNLGASQQATAVSDATEASAGWYWQFNLKQGYKHDGATRTPNTTWIGSINENSDWTTANDPCALELGTGWRIPTSTEWTNVDASGGWTNWNGPWNSLLKMHAAGYLSYSDGSLDNRGSYGIYWSGTQGGDIHGWSLYFGSGDCTMLNDSKAYGFTLRCVRD